MIRALIVDDEEDARFMLRSLIKRHFSDQIEIAGEADSVSDGIELINRLKPELLFLDIRMNRETGFDLLHAIENKDFEVVFVTAYDEYAVNAFRFSAMGYLMKPVKISALREIVESFIKKSTDERNDARSLSLRRRALGVLACGSYRAATTVIAGTTRFSVRRAMVTLTVWPSLNSRKSDSIPSPKMTPPSSISLTSSISSPSFMKPKLIPVPVAMLGQGSRTM